MSDNTSPAPRKIRIGLRDILVLQAVIVLYTLASASGKAAAGQSWLSLSFFAFYGLELVILGVYALAWQQVIKKFPLSVAYANRAVAILWSMVWAVVFFREAVTPMNLAGVALVLAGTWVVNSDET